MFGDDFDSCIGDSLGEMVMTQGKQHEFQAAIYSCFVVDGAQVVLNYLFRYFELIGYFAVLVALNDE